MKNAHYLAPGAPEPLNRAQTYQFWDNLMHWLPVGIFTCGQSGLITRYNRRAAEIWRRSPDLRESRERYTAGEPVGDEELWIERPDGSRLAALIGVTPLFEEDGKPAGAVACEQDITQLKQSQALVAERELWIRQLLDALPAAVYTTDATGMITFYNHAAGGRAPSADVERIRRPPRLADNRALLRLGAPRPRHQAGAEGRRRCLLRRFMPPGHSTLDLARA